MSLILDALRKSEAERRRGQAPSLYSGLPVLSTRQRPAWLRTLPWVVGGVLVLVALFAFRHDDEPATKAELEQSADSDSASAAPIAPVAPAPAPAPVSAPAPGSPPVAPAANVDALLKPPVAGARTPAASRPSSPLPAPPAAPAPSAEEALPPLAVLDAATRAALPPMKLSMHVYNSDATRRFAIIDGQRVTEGTQLGAAVVTEIRHDGVVLEVGGQRVLLPRP